MILCVIFKVLLYHSQVLRAYWPNHATFVHWDKKDQNYRVFYPFS